MTEDQNKLIEIRYILSDAMAEIEKLGHPFSKQLMECNIQIIDALLRVGEDNYLQGIDLFRKLEDIQQRPYGNA